MLFGSCGSRFLRSRIPERHRAYDDDGIERGYWDVASLVRKMGVHDKRHDSE